MIAKSHRRADAYGAARYLHGEGKHHEDHTYIRDGVTHIGGEVIDGYFVRRGATDGQQWARGMMRVVARREQNGGRKIKNPIYDASLRVAPGEHLTDDQWREAVQIWLIHQHAENFPYVVVRHAHDHVHIVVSRVNTDGELWKGSHDYVRNETACREIEKRFGLRQLESKPERRGKKRDSLARVTPAEKAIRARGGTPRKDLMRAERAEQARAQAEWEAERALTAVQIAKHDELLAQRDNAVSEFEDYELHNTLWLHDQLTDLETAGELSDHEYDLLSDLQMILGDYLEGYETADDLYDDDWKYEQIVSFSERALAWEQETLEQPEQDTPEPATPPRKHHHRR